MTSRMIRNRLCALLSALFVFGAAHLANAQTVPFQPAGVEIDADGLMRAKIFNDHTGELTRQRIAAAKQTLPQDLQEASQLRKVSLNRLERHIAKRLADGEKLDDAIRNLAGLTQITHVFYYPETKDIVIAGPAEGFYTDVSGRTVGLESGRAIMQLEDLLVALRAFSPDGNSTRVIGCSIDPTKEGLTNFVATSSDIKRRAANNEFSVSGNEVAIMDSLRESLGKQTVTVKGVPANTHFAQVLVEADYRMKMIGIGLEQVPVKIAVWAEKVKARQVARNALVRWYFTPDYERIQVSEDENAMQLIGDGVKLISADERVASDGSRQATKGVDRASRNFTRTFTEKYSQLAEQNPVFAQLRNLMDMAIVAAFIKEMDYYGKAGWDMELFADESKLKVETYTTPKHVEPLINGMWKGSQFATPIGGGVNIQAAQALTVDNLKVDESGEVNKVKSSISFNDLNDDQWWWD